MTISIKTVLSAAAPLLLVTGVLLSTPSAATDAREAIRRCDAAPPCHFTVDRDGGLTVFGASGGIVQCPAKGPCSVVANIKGDRPKPGSGVGKVPGVLAASPRGTAKSEILTKKMGGLVDDKKVGTLQAAGARTDGSKKH